MESIAGSTEWRAPVAHHRAQGNVDLRAVFAANPRQLHGSGLGATSVSARSFVVPCRSADVDGTNHAVRVAGAASRVGFLAVGASRP